MARRHLLHDILVALLGSRNVYFQPPESITMQYPCIVYSLDNVSTRHADNNPYTLRDRYLVTVIDRDPDSPIPKNVGKLPTASFSRAFVTENLNHTAFTLYF